MLQINKEIEKGRRKRHKILSWFISQSGSSPISLLLTRDFSL